MNHGIEKQRVKEEAEYKQFNEINISCDDELCCLDEDWEIVCDKVKTVYIKKREESETMDA